MVRRRPRRTSGERSSPGRRPQERRQRAEIRPTLVPLPRAGPPADRRVAARVEEALPPVVPADAVVLVARLAEHLEDLPAAPLLTDPVLVHLDYVAGPYARGLLG